MEEKNLLSVKNLEVKYFLRNSTVEAVNDISFHIGRGERELALWAKPALERQQQLYLLWA